MKFLEKNALFNKHKNVAALKADKKLLLEKDSESKVLKTKFFDAKREANEILYALLDVVSIDEILKNRRKRMRPAPKKKEEDLKLDQGDGNQKTDQGNEEGKTIQGTEDKTAGDAPEGSLPPADDAEKKSPEDPITTGTEPVQQDPPPSDPDQDPQDLSQE